ncbi:MAG: AMP-binding protein, partial [Muribaculaceae bacterium]|nr:AMP-binding protein [Muribaculaceae bacterium]
MARTSGSTGKAKEIRLPKEFVRRSALRTNRFFSIDSRSRLHSCVSPDFIGGKMMAVRSEMAGCRLTYETPSNRPLKDVEAGEITLLSVVPSQMLGLLDSDGNLPPVRHYLIGGSSLSTELRNKICDSGVDAWESYGMTETASHIALRRVEREEGWFEAFSDISLRLDARG